METIWEISRERLSIGLRFRLFNLVQDGGQKDPPTSFSPVTSTNLEISFQHFLTFNFNSFATLV